MDVKVLSVRGSGAHDGGADDKFEVLHEDGHLHSHARQRPRPGPAGQARIRGRIGLRAAHGAQQAQRGANDD